MATNNIKFNVKNGLSVGASGFEVINPAGEWVGASGPSQSPYGATGSQGYAGVDGASGIQGLDGASGAQGLTGDQGNFGQDGEQGVVGEQGTQAPDGAIKLQHTYEWTNDQLQWRGNAYAGGASPSVSRLEFLSTDAVYGYLASIAPGTKLVIDWNGLSVATVTTIGTVQAPTAYTSGRHYLRVSANPDGYASGGYGSTNINDVLMIGDGPRNQGYRGGLGDDGVQGSTGASGIDGASGVDGYQGVQGASGADGDLGASGIDGASGPTGEIGIQGASGSDGDLGASGIDGASGPTGQDGATGIDGASGTTGDSGIDGASGVTGQDGATGPSGSRYHTTSTTNLNLTTGATGVVVVDDHLQYSAGQTILLADGGGKHIHASVISYNENTKVLAFTPIDHVGTGSSNSWEINLDGAEGAAGASGVTGQAGATGATGIDGYQGVVGSTGTTGDVGEQGYQGASGADGYQGVDGATGTTGDLGEQGYTGATGIDGYQGVIGSTGTTGDLGEQGYQGETGLDGVQGATGTIGDQGETGDTGYQGVQGASGAKGIVGERGETGVIGEDGLQGASGATGFTGATGAQGTDGSGYSIIETDSVADGDWGTIWYTGSTTTGDGSARLSFNIADPVYTHLAALSVGQSIVIDFPNAAVVSGLSQTSPQTVTVTEAITVDGTFNTHKIKVSAEPSNSASTQLFSTNPPDTIFYLLYTSPTNTGYTGSTGVNGLQGDVGNAGYDADQLTYGTPRGAWDIGTYYYVDDIVVTIAPSPDSHRCIVPNIGNDPDTTSGYWVTTAYAGASGASGITGEVGIDGASGVTGETGTDGASGVTGIDGATGITGTDGASGVTGQDGATGIDGLSGIDGASGPTGDTGTDGATGYNGLQFKATANGNFSVYAIGTPITIPFLADPDTGFNSYNYSVGQSVVIAQDANNYMVADVTGAYGSFIEVIVTKAVGTASSVTGWIVNLDGAVGQIGASGATGIDGYQGLAGATGVQGPNGDQGTTGDNGEQGVSGQQGLTGDQGNTGQQGLNGDSGVQGPNGDQGTTGASGPQGIVGATGHIGATGYGLGLGATSFTGTSQQTIELFAANQYGTTKYLIQGIDADDNVQATQVILTHNATGVYMTEYATLNLSGAQYGDFMSLFGTEDLSTSTGSPEDLNA